MFDLATRLLSRSSSSRNPSLPAPALLYLISNRSGLEWQKRRSAVLRSIFCLNQHLVAAERLAKPQALATQTVLETMQSKAWTHMRSLVPGWWLLMHGHSGTISSS